MTVAPAMQGEYGDVAVPESGVTNRLSDQVPRLPVHEELRDAVAGRDAQPLSHVDLGEGNLVGD